VVLKCILAESGDVMRLRAPWPLRLEQVQELICQAIGTTASLRCEDPLGEPRPLTDELLAELCGATGGRSPAIIRLRLHTGAPRGPHTATSQGDESSAAAAQARTSAAPAVRDQRRRLRQKARRQRRRAERAEASLEHSEERAAAAPEDAMHPPAEEEEHASDGEAVTIRACDIMDGMRLWVEGGPAKRFLQVTRDGSVDFNGEFQEAASFIARGPAVSADETAVTLEGPTARILRCRDGGHLENLGADIDDAACRFSFVDVAEGVVLFLGPPGTGHVRAALSTEAPRAGREGAPQGFRLLAAPLLARGDRAVGSGEGAEASA